MPLLLGSIEDATFTLPDSVLRKHVVVLGASGSGKTVLCKAIVEEATMAGIPSILIDPQGDLASLALPGDESEVVRRGGDPERMRQFRERAEVRVFTPASSRGIPMSCDPLQVSREGLSPEEIIHTLDLIATSLTLLLGYDVEIEKGRACKALLYKILERGHDEGDWPEDLEKFAARVEAIWKSIELYEEWRSEDAAALKSGAPRPKKVELDPLASDAQALTEPSTMKSVSRNLRFLAVGVNKLIFNFGVGITLDRFLQPITPGKVPVNVIYLNTLQSEEQKHFFTAMVAREVYNWMLQNPTDSQDAPPQLLFYIDEVSTYMPAGAREPPAEPILRLIFKQGRKYGVSMVTSTQNFGDLDYKSMSQASTWAIGRLTVKQDHEKIKPILKALNVPVEEIPKAVGALKPGTFVLVAPDLFPTYKEMKTRWLYTAHRTLPDDELRDAMEYRVVESFDRLVNGNRVSREGPTPEEAVAAANLTAAGTSPVAGPPSGAVPIAVPVASAMPEELPQFPSLRPGPVPAIIARLAVSRDAAMAVAQQATGPSGGKQNVRAVALRWFPIWQIEIGAKRGLFSGLVKRGGPEYVYLSGEKETIMVVTDQMRFKDQVPPDPRDIVDIDGSAEWYSQGVDVAQCLPPEIAQTTAKNLARDTFGAEVAAVRLCYMPIWELEVEGRKILVDGVMGRELQL